MHMFRKRALISLVIGGCLLFGAVPIKADRRSDCEKKIHKAEKNLDKEIRKHGEHSRQAEKRRHELEEAHEHCRDYDHDRH